MPNLITRSGRASALVTASAKATVDSGKARHAALIFAQHLRHARG